MHATQPHTQQPSHHIHIHTHPQMRASRAETHAHAVRPPALLRGLPILSKSKVSAPRAGSPPLLLPSPPIRCMHAASCTDRPAQRVKIRPPRGSDPERGALVTQALPVINRCVGERGLPGACKSGWRRGAGWPVLCSAHGGSRPRGNASIDARAGRVGCKWCDP